MYNVYTLSRFRKCWYEFETEYFACNLDSLNSANQNLKASPKKQIFFRAKKVEELHKVLYYYVKSASVVYQNLFFSLLRLLRKCNFPNSALICARAIHSFTDPKILSNITFMIYFSCDLKVKKPIFINNFTGIRI